MTTTTESVAATVAAVLRDTDGVVRLYPPSGKIPLLATAAAALQEVRGQVQPLVAVTAADGIMLIRAALGINGDVIPAVLLRELTNTIRSHLASTDPILADTARIDLTIVHITS